MEKLEISVKELIDIVANNKIVGGAFGLVYELDDNTLFNFKYKEFADCFEIKDRKLNLRKLLDISEYIIGLKSIGINGLSENAERVLNLKDKIKLTNLSKGIVLVDGYCVGYLVERNKDMINLRKYKMLGNELSQKAKKEIMNNIEAAVKELNDNNIFVRDLGEYNILINPKNNQVQITDIEEAAVAREDRPKHIVCQAEDKLKRFKEYFLAEKQKEKTL